MAAVERASDGQTSPVSGGGSGWRSLLGNRLLLSLLAVSLVPMALLGLASQRASSAALKEQAFKELETINTITGRGVERYFQTLHDELRVLAEDRMIVVAIREFATGMKRLIADDRVDDKEVARARRALQGFYDGEFSAAFRKATGGDPDTRALAAALDDASAWLQDLYIRGNEHPLGQKARLDAAVDGSAYTKAHAVYHPILRHLQEKYGLYDLFLVDAAGGTIVYSVCKEIDFTASLRTGPIAGTNLGRCVQEALATGTRDAVSFGVFDRYLPSLMQPASFIAAPVFDGRELVGAVAFQIPLDRVGKIVGETTGMGRTGETYAVGADGLFRTQSRFAVDLGVESTILNPKLKVDTPQARAALDEGGSGTALGTDYRGVPVLASWRPVTVHADSAGGRGTVRWALISQIDQAEVLAPVSRLLRFGLGVFGVTTLGVLAVSVTIARRMTREAERQARL
ncbi:MAG: hypothetical protein FJ275_02710, partial [Planctomycetes bacterium]|nr:hypothetical protein [Planctomycetota bacterium]